MRAALLLTLCSLSPALAQADTVAAIGSLLAQERVDLGFDATALAGAVDALQDEVWLNLAVDPRVDTNKPVAIVAADRALGDLLDLIQESHGLERVVWCDVLYLHPRGAPPWPGPSTELDGALAGYTLRAKDESLTEALHTLLDLAGVELVVPDEWVERATQAVTLRVRNLPLHHALTLLTRQAGLSWRLQDGAVALIDAPPPPALAAAGPLEQRLDEVELTLQLVESPLEETLSTLAVASQVEIRLEGEGHGPDVTLQLRGTSLREALDQLAREAGVSWRVQSGAVVVQLPDPR